ncbi:MAG: class I SAM-dependent methyltransferase [Gemmataceae bacterium]|nr:class I SAM-dependent methyltransferase [Gemmataceae bacterium]
MPACPICNGDMAPAYEGPVRDGVFGRSVPAVVWGCRRCGVEHLPPRQADLSAYYQSEDYRKDVGEGADVESYFRRHDDEQLGKMALLAGMELRGKVVADIGCAGGSFLDTVRGLASATVGVEPALAYHGSLKQRGHRVYRDVVGALAEWRGRVDVATSFSVIEHVEDPVGFLRDIRDLLTEDGLCLVSTPNRADILMKLDPRYQAFFYRTVHTFYFDEKALRATAEAAGLRVAKVKYVHRFGFANFIEWLRQGKPTGDKQISPLGLGFDGLWTASLEASGLADYLYVVFCR